MKIQRNKWSSSNLFVFLISLFSMSLAQADIFSLGDLDLGNQMGLSPFWKIKQIETDHFRIYFPEELSKTALSSAGYLEEAHQILSPALKWEVHYKVPILIVANSDSANGMTAPIGRFGIVLIITPPENWFSTYYYDNWLRFLIIHEYTHMLNMDNTSGAFYGALRYLVGDVFLPNAMLPTWMLEGLAVYMETRNTRGGRGRSPYYDMIIRTAVQEKRLNHSDYITLDQINGRRPTFPGGETPYLFGYYLNQQVSKSKFPNALGEMSSRSGGRVPYFINGNVENITGLEWYDHWVDWVSAAEKQADEELKLLKKNPITPSHAESKGSFEAIGAAASPDGKWLAWTQDSADRRFGLYLKNLSTGKIEHLGDKLMGVGLSFTPDSEWLVGSQLEQQRQYYSFSTLVAYHVPSGRFQSLLSDERAKDPNVSADGKKIAYVRTLNQSQQIVVADLILSNGKLSVAHPQVIYEGKTLDSVQQPKFDPSGNRVVFSTHPNGLLQENLIEIELSSGKAKTLVSDGSFNRHAAFSPQGLLYFISDRTGVDTIYRISASGKTESVAHTTTGIWFPAWGPQGLYASVFNLRGWEVSKLDLTAASVNAFPLPSIREIQKSHQPPLPEPAPQPSPVAESKIENYSLYPSILPRQWAPLASFSSITGYSLGGQILGFDAVDRHRYFLSGSIHNRTKLGEWDLSYTNRSFGPQISFDTSMTTLGFLDDHPGDFLRSQTHTFSIIHPFLQTWSAFKVGLGFQWQRDLIYNYFPTVHRESASSYSPRIDAMTRYSNAQSSRMAIGSERGMSAQLGSRTHLAGASTAYQPFVSLQKYIPLGGGHSILTPSFQGSWISRRKAGENDSSVRVASRQKQIVNPFESSSLDQMVLRGYSGKVFRAKSAAIASLDLRFPIERIFRGWGTNPFFFENIYGVGFVEGGYFPNKEPKNYFLPSAGAGVRVNTEFFLHVPIIFAVEVHQGFQKASGGKPEIFFGINLASLSL